MVRAALVLVALSWPSASLAQQAAPQLQFRPTEPQLQLNGSNFALPVIDYQAPDGTLKRSHGIIIGRDISPNATVGLGVFKMTPKYSDPNLPTAVKSRKIAVGFSLRF